MGSEMCIRDSGDIDFGPSLLHRPSLAFGPAKEVPVDISKSNIHEIVCLFVCLFVCLGFFRPSREFGDGTISGDIYIETLPWLATIRREHATPTVTRDIRL